MDIISVPTESPTAAAAPAQPSTATAAAESAAVPAEATAAATDKPTFGPASASATATNEPTDAPGKPLATHENLKAALARKAVTGRLYAFLARQADREGRRDLARLFRELSDGETLHAFGLLEHIRHVGDPLTGKKMDGWESYVANAVAASREEAETLFPEMAAAARADNLPDEAEWFDSLARAEKNHADRLTRYLESLRSP